MDFTIKINCDDDWMQYATEEKIATILERVGQEVKQGKVFGKIQDANGNTIGDYNFVMAK